MASRLLNIMQPILDLEGNPEVDRIKQEDGSIKNIPVLLKHLLMGYLSLADRMGCSMVEQSIAFATGTLIGMAKDQEITLAVEQYDLVKKLCDKMTYELNSRQEPRFSLVLAQQAKLMVDQALVKDA